MFEMAMAINAAKYRAAAEFCRRRGWGLLATDGYRTRRLLEHREVDPRLDTALSLALADGQELSWPQVRAAADALPLGTLDLSALILRQEWEWRSRPFRLRAHPPAEPSDPGATSAVAAPEGHRAAALVATGSQPIVLPSPKDIEAARSPAGGWSRQQLAAWGVPWPPPKGWKDRLTARWKAQ